MRTAAHDLASQLLARYGRTHAQLRAQLVRLLRQRSPRAQRRAHALRVVLGEVGVLEGVLKSGVDMSGGGTPWQRARAREQAEAFREWKRRGGRDSAAASVWEAGMA